MKKNNNGGFTLTEILVAMALALLVIAVVIPAWTMTSRILKNESDRTSMRIDLVKALETIKSELRLTNLNYMCLYPEGGGPYTGISFPVAETDANGFFTINDGNDIDWDKTVIYHIYQEGSGPKTLRRTIIESRDNSMTETQRMAELQNVVTSGEGPDGSSTNEDFLINVDTFEIQSLSPIIDFYDPSDTPVRVGKVTFGWAQLVPGDHTIRFTITGSNPDSSGSDIGIDSIMIEPSGSMRDAEYYATDFAPPGALLSVGGATSTVYSSMWSNNGYLEFAGGADNYIEISDSYDLWRESAFDNISMDNVKKTGNEARIELELPDNDEPGTIDWMAVVEAGEENDMLLPDSSVPPMVIRNIVTSPNIAETADFIRVKFRSSSNESLTIGRAYITRRSTTEGCNGLENETPGSLEPDEYHMHQQIFFDQGGTITPGITIPANSEVWSVWTAFPFTPDNDYLVSIYLSDVTDMNCKGWTGDPSKERSFYINTAGWLSCTADSSTDIFTSDSHSLIDGDAVVIFGDSAPVGLSMLSDSFPEMAGTPFWHYYVANATNDTFQLSITSDGSDIVDFAGNGSNLYVKKIGYSNDIFITEEIDGRVITGSVTSGIFDTTLASPSYNEVKWSEEPEDDTEITLKVRSDNDRYMTGADIWDIVPGVTNNPASLSISADRYVQFRAELTSGVFWESSGSKMDYSDYISAQKALPVYDFPQSGGPMVAGAYSNCIDDVEITWDGEESLCAITGYIAKKNDYGQAKITVDGSDLEKILRVFIKLSSTDFAGRRIVEENYIDIEPRNTGK